MNERQIGYILLGVGIVIMIFSAFQIITVLTGQAKPMQIFSYNPKASGTDMTGMFEQMQRTAAAQAGSTLQSGANPAPTSFMNPQLINNLINLTIFYVIMQFILGIGYKLATLGVQMLRPIVVQVKNKKLEAMAESEESPKLNKLT